MSNQSHTLHLLFSIKKNPLNPNSSCRIDLIQHAAIMICLDNRSLKSITDKINKY